MDKNKKPTDQQDNKDRNIQNDPQRENVKQAHEQADKDIEADAELSAHSPNDDLDEGETARLGENNNGLV